MKSVPLHAWIRPISIAYLPGSLTPALHEATSAIFEWLRGVNCRITSQPHNSTDLIITTARLGDVVHRDEALLFHAKRNYRLSRRPQVLTIVDVPEPEYQRCLHHFAELAHTPEAELAGVGYDGLGPQAVEVIAHQARRGGPELAFSRLVQAQVLSIRVMALRTDYGRPWRAMHFDLAGARPISDASDLEVFGADVGARILAANCTQEVNDHLFSPDPVPGEIWDALRSPDLMVRAGNTFTEYGFFTTPIYVDKLLGYRGISEAIASQYSEGCYGVYDPDLGGLITTATGSSRLVDKRAITRADQAVVVGVKPGGDGAIVRGVAGREQVVPSVEAVEMMSICQAVGSHQRPNARGEWVTVPNAAAVLHGHLGVASYDPAYVEAVTLEPLYYTQLVSCGTGALAQATARAFGRSEALRRFDDPRRVVFLEQPGHGVMIVEKWAEPGSGSEPFDLIRQHLETRRLQMTFDIPQGPIEWVQDVDAEGRPVRRKAATLERVF